MRLEKKYTQKEWDKFKQFTPKTVRGKTKYLDVQEWMCKKYNIILTDFETKRQKKINFLKKFSMKNLNSGIVTFNKYMQEFGSIMDQLSNEFGTPPRDESDKNIKNLKKIWGEPKSKSNVKIWSSSPTSQLKSQRPKDEINLEKIWGKRK